MPSDSKRKSLGKGLFTRGSSTVYRRTFPEDVREALGTTEIVKSLGAVSLAEARQLATALQLLTTQAIEDVREAGLPQAELLRIRERLRLSIEDRVAERVRADRARRLSQGMVEDAEGNPWRDDLADEVDEIEGEGDAATLLRFLQSGVELPPGTPYAMTLSVAKLWARGEVRAAEAVGQDRVAEHRGELAPSTHAAVAPPPQALALDLAGLADAVAAKVNGGGTEPMALGILVERLIAAKAGAGVRTPGLACERWKRDLDDFLSYFGAETLASDVTLEGAEAWRDQLLETLKPSTVKQRMAGGSAVMTYAVERGYAKTNPVALARPQGKGNSKGKVPFSSAELRRIFGDRMVAEAQGVGVTGRTSTPKPYRYWIPLLLLHHGLRLGEAAQLRVDDVTDTGSHLLVRVTDEGRGQRLKTAASARHFVVHPELIRRGFRQYLASVSAGEWLWPELVSPAMVRRMDKGQQVAWDTTFGTWFSSGTDKVGQPRNLLAWAGVTRAGLSAHSFRHAWRRAGSKAGVEDIELDALGGWTARSMAAHYGRDASQVDVEHLAKLAARWNFSAELAGLPELN